jgi:hypothetical protein
MKIAVTRCDGDTEILTLTDPVKITDGPGQACIHNANGVDHFFRLSDGRYDGYGIGAPDEGWTQNQAQTISDAFQVERKIIPVSIRYILAARLRKIWWFVRWHFYHALGKEGF